MTLAFGCCRGTGENVVVVLKLVGLVLELMLLVVLVLLRGEQHERLGRVDRLTIHRHVRGGGSVKASGLVSALRCRCRNLLGELGLPVRLLRGCLRRGEVLLKG